eukprot:jgi/Mesvir1/23773/Mv10598-RA.1
MLLWRHLLASRSSPRRHMPPGMTAWLANLTRIPFTRRSVSQLVDICLLCAERSTERLLGCFGPLFVLLAVAILALVVFVFFHIVVPFFLNAANASPWLVAAKVVTACWMLLNVTLNYVLCIVTRPGASPDIKDMGPNAAAMLQGCTTTMKKSGRWCKKCKKPKPPLSHHCSICRHLDAQLRWILQLPVLLSVRFLDMGRLRLWRVGIRGAVSGDGIGGRQPHPHHPFAGVRPLHRHLPYADFPARVARIPGAYCPDDGGVLLQPRTDRRRQGQERDMGQPL